VTWSRGRVLAHGSLIVGAHPPKTQRMEPRRIAPLFSFVLAGACADGAETHCGSHAAHSGSEAPAPAHAPSADERAADPSQHHAHGGMQHDFSDVERFEAVFDAPERAAWQRPVEVVRLLGAAPGQTVVDLGTGTGYFLPYLSVAVGPEGSVLGLDTERAMVEHVQQRAGREGLANVEARVVPADAAGLAPASVDRILIVNTWHHLQGRPRYAARLREALRPGGEVLVVDFTLESPQGPSVDHRLPPDRVVEELTAGGLDATVVSEEGLPDQYVVRAVKR
jgi:predicted methyltransferase